MMRRFLGVILCLLFTVYVQAQSIETGIREGNSGHTKRENEQINTVYNSPQNAQYWKNRKPFEGYWQQDVMYKIKALVDEKTDQIVASLNLKYFNNSPDTLTYVYFHLYQNAFQPGSYNAELHEANDYPTVWGPYEKEGKGTEIKSLKVKGKETKTELDNTILKVWLN